MPHFTKVGQLPQSCYAAFVVNASTEPAEIRLDRGGQDIDVSHALYRTNPGDATLTPVHGPIAAGESAVLFISDQTSNAVGGTWSHLYTPCPTGIEPAVRFDLPAGTRRDVAFHLTSTAPVNVVTMYPFGGARSFLPTASLALPVAGWGKEHVLLNAWEANDAEPSAQIMAAEDDTVVTINPVAAIERGPGIEPGPAHVPVTYRMNKGEYLQLVQWNELTGSIVTSDKPTSIVGGHGCPFLPSTQGTCDILAQQLPSFEQWGNEYVGVGYRPRLGDEYESLYYRIVAAKDDTRLDYDPAVPPGAPVHLSAGEVATFTSGTGEAFVVRSQDLEHPIYLGAYMTGGSAYSGEGDPEYVNVVPSAQYLNTYSFYADPSYGDTSLVIVRAKTNGEFKDVWLECAGNLTGFQPIGTRGQYEFVRVDLARKGRTGQTFGEGKVCRNGLHRMKSEGPFGATVWGWDYAASYAYPGGMGLRRLASTSLVH